jgi:hypothetical protein
VQHFFAFDVLGEIAFSRKFGFLESGTDLEGAIKTIDEVQRYDGIIGQIPEWDFALRRNPLAKFLPGMDPSKSLITRMALEELGKRKKYGEKVIDRKDLLSHLMAANEKAPDVFKEGDVLLLTSPQLCRVRLDRINHAIVLLPCPARLCHIHKLER